MCKNSLREGTVFVYYQDHQTFRGFVDLVEGADLRSAPYFNGVFDEGLVRGLGF